MPESDTRLLQSVSLRDPATVWRVLADTVRDLDPGHDLARVRQVYEDVLRLFAGRYPGYRECNTPYHDLNHTTDVVLAMARLMHGAKVCGQPLSRRGITLGLVSTFLHDTGYIQEETDTEGTGAKYAHEHVRRSVAFMDKYLTAQGWSEADRATCRYIILRTELGPGKRAPEAPDPEADLLAKMLGTADLLGQMADRTYLEKLLFLFQEFREGDVGGFDSELDLLEHTLEFCGQAQARMENELGGVRRFMAAHYRATKGLEVDPYTMGIRHHVEYLRDIVQNHRDDYREYLKREGLMDKLSDLYESG